MKKNSMRKAVLVVGVLFVLIASCSKEQRVVNKLEGTWKATEATTEFAGLSLQIPISEFTEILFTFNECKVKDGPCSGVSSYDGVTDDFSYTIGGDANTIQYLDSLGQEQSLTLLELEKESFKIDDFGVDTLTNLTVKFIKQ
jgi:hypothetical protein